MRILEPCQDTPKKNMATYIGTVTFDSNYSLEQKDKLIEELPMRLSKHLRHHNSSEYYMKWCREYHKVEGQDDFEAPHIHFMIESRRVINKCYVNSIREMLKCYYGRSDFSRATTMRANAYERYMQKDCDRLLQQTKKSHYWEMFLEPVIEKNMTDDDSDYSDYEK